MLSRLSPYWLWLVLALPALAMIPDLAGGDDRALHHLLHPTGEFAARFMILSMLATPLMMLTKGARWARWLRANRRYFGVAAFAYAALHTLFYVLSTSGFDRILAQATQFDMATGWLAFALFLPLAATSMDYAVRKLGTRWKQVQRLTYAAAALTLLHWASLHGWREIPPALVHFTPLAVLTLYRLWWLYLRPRNRPATA